MSLYREYLNESTKEYRYRIKTVVPIETNEMNKIENVLKKYDLKDVSTARRTPIQEHPLEFVNISNREVYILDANLGMPASTQQLHSELYDALEVTADYIVVRSESDPILLQTEDANSEEDYETKLSTDSEYLDSEQIKDAPDYGDEYNQNLLSRVARAKVKVESEIGLDKTAYNKDMPGVKPEYEEKEAQNNSKVTHRGNHTRTVK